MLNEATGKTGVNKKIIGELNREIELKKGDIETWRKQISELRRIMRKLNAI